MPDEPIITPERFLWLMRRMEEARRDYENGDRKAKQTAATYALCSIVETLADMGVPLETLQPVDHLVNAMLDACQGIQDAILTPARGIENSGETSSSWEARAYIAASVEAIYRAGQQGGGYKGKTYTAAAEYVAKRLPEASSMTRATTGDSRSKRAARAKAIKKWAERFRGEKDQGPRLSAHRRIYRDNLGEIMRKQGAGSDLVAEANRLITMARMLLMRITAP